MCRNVACAEIWVTVHGVHVHVCRGGAPVGKPGLLMWCPGLGSLGSGDQGEAQLRTTCASLQEPEQ